MARIYQTDNSGHAQAVSQALIDAADGDTWKIRTTTGNNGRVAFEVPDDFPDTDVPDAEHDDAQGGGALHSGSVGALGDTAQNQEEPGEEVRHPAGRRRKGTKTEDQNTEARATQQS